MKLLKSFSYAFRGIWICIHQERNFRIHTVAILTVVIFSILYGLPIDKYPVLILILALVPSLEAINTAIERAVDIEAENPHPLAKDAKDAASGAVLISAIASVVMACFLFSDIEKLTHVALIFTRPLSIVALIIYIVISATYVFVPNHK